MWFYQLLRNDSFWWAVACSGLQDCVHLRKASHNENRRLTENLTRFQLLILLHLHLHLQLEVINERICAQTLFIWSIRTIWHRGNTKCLIDTRPWCQREWSLKTPQMMKTLKDATIEVHSCWASPDTQLSCSRGNPTLWKPQRRMSIYLCIFCVLVHQVKEFATVVGRYSFFLLELLISRSDIHNHRL